MDSKTIHNLDGTYFKTGSSEAIAATIEKNERGYRVVHDGDILNFCGTKEIKVTNRLVNTPRTFYFPDGGKMVVDDGPAFDEWFASRSKNRFFRRLNRYESSWTAPMLALISIPLLFLVFFNVVIPLLANPIAKMIPQHYADSLDQFTLSELDSFLAPSKLKQLDQLRISAAFDSVQSALPDTKMYLYIRDGNEFIGANAFALPGGSIIMTDQVLDAGLSTAEITAIFAHEAGHVYYKHSIKQLIKSSSVGVTLTLLFNDLSAIGQWILVSGGTVLQTTSYSRDAERQADEFGREIVSELGISTGCFGTALQKLTSYDSELASNEEIAEEDTIEEDAIEDIEARGALYENLFEWLSTHPTDAERINASSNSCQRLE